MEFYEKRSNFKYSFNKCLFVNQEFCINDDKVHFGDQQHKLLDFAALEKMRLKITPKSMRYDTLNTSK